MKHDSITINEFKQILDQHEGQNFTYKDVEYKINEGRLFYKSGNRCFWYSWNLDFTEGVKNELLRNSNR